MALAALSLPLGTSCFTIYDTIYVVQVMCNRLGVQFVMVVQHVCARYVKTVVVQGLREA